MVADDEVDAFFLGILNLFDCLDSAIEHNNQLHADFGSVVDTFHWNAISFLVTGGDIVFHIRIKIKEILIHKCYGSCSVNVVVAIHHNFLLQPHGIIKPLHRFVHILHEEWVVHLWHWWVEELLHFVPSLDASLHQQLANGRAVGKLSRQLGLYSFLFGCQG